MIVSSTGDIDVGR